MMMRFGTDFANGAGLDLSDRLSLYPCSALATGQVFPPMCQSTSSTAAQIAGMPMLHHAFQFEVQNDKLVLGLDPFAKGVYNLPGSLTYQPDHLAYIASYHRYWRGSIKYYIQFVTNAFTTARFRLSYLLDSNDPVTIVGGDYPSKVIEVKGTTEIAVSVPFLWFSCYKPVGYVQNEDVLYPSLVIQMITAPVNFGANAPVIDCVVWRSGGEDIQFMGACRSIIDSLIPSAEGQTSIWDKFSKPFEPIGCDCHFAVEAGFVSSETTGPIIDMMRRYVPLAPQTDIATLPRSLTYATTGYNYGLDLFYGMANMFKYWRGSVRLKQELPTSTAAEYTTLQERGGTGIDPSSGYALTVPSHNPFLATETPWISGRPYLATNDDSYTVPYEFEPCVPVILSTGISTVIAAGDDFRMFYLLDLQPLQAPAQTGEETTTITTVTKTKVVDTV